jgi:hypothetical protein
MFVMFAVSALSRRSILLGYAPLIVLLIVFARQPSGVLFWVLFAIWMSGFLLGWIYSRGLLASARFAPVAAALATVFAVCIYAVAGDRWLEYAIEPLQRLGDQAHVVMMLMSFLFILGLASLVRRGTNVTLGAKAAGYSYTLYLIHYPLLLLGFALLHPLLHGYGWVLSALTAIAVLAAVVWAAARVAPLIENREFFSAIFFGSRAGRVFAR